MSSQLSTAQVPDAEILRVDKTATSVAPGVFLSLDLNPFKYRRKLWFAVGVVNTPGSLVIEASVRYRFNGQQVFELPFNVNAFPNTQSRNIFFGTNALFGTSSAINVFDEPVIADFGGKFLASTPWRSVITADVCEFDIKRFSMAGGDTFFGFMVIQQEFPY